LPTALLLAVTCARRAARGPGRSWMKPAMAPTTSSILVVAAKVRIAAMVGGIAGRQQQRRLERHSHARHSTTDPVNELRLERGRDDNAHSSSLHTNAVGLIERPWHLRAVHPHTSCWASWPWSTCSRGCRPTTTGSAWRRSGRRSPSRRGRPRGRRSAAGSSPAPRPRWPNCAPRTCFTVIRHESGAEATAFETGHRGRSYGPDPVRRAGQ
jgi:hypothetical protein